MTSAGGDPPRTDNGNVDPALSIAVPCNTFRYAIARLPESHRQPYLRGEV